MGLDMYVFSVPAERVKNEPQTDASLGDAVHELHYWRKHHDLHGWMERLYQRKGGQSDEFNCNNVRLLPEDLDELEKAVKEDGAVLPVTMGFFFGNNPPDDESRAEDLAFIAKAREAIAAGNALFYDSWW